MCKSKKNNSFFGLVKNCLFIFLIISYLSSCSIQKENINNNLSEKETEYYYSFLEANRLKILGDYNNALKLFVQCLEIKPTSDASMHEIARIYNALGNSESAIKYAKMAIKQDPKNKFYYYTLADIYMDNQLIEQATDVYESIIKIDPENQEVSYYLAMLYKQSGKFNNALEILDQLEANVGINESISINKQQIFLIQRKKTKAYEEINKLINQYPEEAKYYALLAEMFTRDNLLLKAEETFNQLFEIDSVNPEGQLILIDFYRRKVDYENVFISLNKVISNDNVEYNSKVMLLYSFLNNYKEVNLYEEQIEKSLLLFKEIYSDKIDGFNLYSDFLVKRNRYQDAANQLETALKSFSSNEVVWEQLISIYSYLGNFNKMYEKSVIAVDSFPESQSFYLYKGISALQVKKEEIAIESLLKGAMLAKDNKELESNYYIYLGETYQSIKNYVQSEFYFEKALELKPNDVYVLNNYSYYLALRDEKLEYAEKMSRITINSEPENSTYLDTYAYILLKLGKVKEALIYIKKAFDSGGFQNAVIVEHFGDILIKNDNPSEAIKMWDLSIKLGNNNNEIKNKIELYQKSIQ